MFFFIVVVAAGVAVAAANQTYGFKIDYDVEISALRVDGFTPSFYSFFFWNIVAGECGEAGSVYSVLARAHARTHSRSVLFLYVDQH